ASPRRRRAFPPSACLPITGSIGSGWNSRRPIWTRLPPASGRPIPRSTVFPSRIVAMPRIDETRPFLPVNIAVLTVSDTRSEADDRSGRTLVELIAEAGHRLAQRRIVRDERNEIIAQLKDWIADPSVDVVISTGGTGVTGRDVTPEAFHAVYEKEIAGFGELFRMLSYQKIGTSTIQSRASAGVSGGTY